MSFAANRNQSGPATSALVSHSDITAFADSSVNLKREDAEDFRAQVSRLRDKLDKYAADHPEHGLIKTLLSGSLAKGTALKTLNDIDVAFYVKGEKSERAESDLLEWLAARVREAYPQMQPSQIKPNRHAVTISYAVSGLNVDIVPVIYRGDPDDRGYLYAFDGGDPVMTSIPLHLRFTRKRKTDNPHDFAQVVRLIKWWARLQKAENDQFRFKSFMAELLVSRLADSGTGLGDYCDALEGVFTYIVKSQLKTRISFTDYYPASSLPASTGKPIEIIDPVNSANNVAKDYDEQHRRRIVEAAQDALEAISAARYATSRGSAIASWQIVLGPSFRG